MRQRESATRLWHEADGTSQEFWQMEALRQSLKIALGLIAVVLVALVVIPERPSLLSGRSEPDSLTVAQADPQAEPAEAPAEPAPPVATTPPQAAEPSPQAATPEPELIQAPATRSVGQQHLERLRAGSGGTAAPAPSPPPASSSEPAPPPAPVAEAAPETPPVPAVEETVPFDDAPPASEPDEPQRSLSSLTEPNARPSFRLFRDPVIRDAATIVTEDQSVSIVGVLPPPAGSTCAGVACDEAARQAFRAWLSGRDLLCAVSPSASPRAQAPCLAGEEDVGEWLISNGWAQAEPGSRYEADEASARERGLGVWAN